MLLLLKWDKLEKKIFEIVKRESADIDLKSLFKKLILETLSNSIEVETQGIYPLQNVYVHKLKILNRPAFDRFKLADLHNESPQDFGGVQRRADDTEFQTDTDATLDDASLLGAKKNTYSAEVTGDTQL